MKKTINMFRLMSFEIKTQWKFFLAFFIISIIFISAFISSYILPCRLSESLDIYARQQGILDIYISCDDADEMSTIGQMPVAIYDDYGSDSGYPMYVLMYAENFSDYFKAIEMLRENHIYYFATCFEEARSLKLIKAASYMIQLFFFAIVVLILDYSSVNMYLQRRSYYLAVLKTQGMSNGQLFFFVSLLMILFQTIACVTSRVVFPFINDYIKSTIEEIFPYIVIDMSVRIQDQVICWSILVVIIFISSFIGINKVRDKDICSRLNRGEE